MLYVSSFDAKSNRYAVTDTDDGSVEYVESGELFGIVRDLHIKVEGVSLSTMQIKVVRPVGGSKPSKSVKPATKPKAGAGVAKKPARKIATPKKKPVKKNNRLSYLEENLGFDYVIEEHEAGDFTEYVVSMGGDTLKYRVYGSDGSYRLVAK